MKIRDYLIASGISMVASAFVLFIPMAILTCFLDFYMGNICGNWHPNRIKGY